MFSVLLSLYFKENPVYLNESLNSIWTEQTVKPEQIVLVLDGPIGEELAQVVNEWETKLDKALTKVVLEQNVGLGKALNEGLKHCRNEWVFRMDTDDICVKDRFEKQLNYIHQNPDIVLFSGQIAEFNLMPNDTGIIKNVPVAHEDIIKFALKRSPFNHMAVAYKKSVIEAVGGYQHHLFMEDYNLWLRVIGAGYMVGNHPDILLYARVGNGMHARRKGYDYIKSEKQLLKLKKELKLQNPIHANILFLLRSSFRLLPSSLLGKIYNTFLRKKVHKSEW